jgi:putative ABC transport system permease protein
MENFVRDLRYAARMLAKSPGFTAAAVVCLALGIGATSAVFSVVDAVLLRALPYSDPDRLVMIWSSGTFSDRQPSSGAELLDYQELTGTFENVSGAVLSFLNLTGLDEPERVAVGKVSPGLLKTLGAPLQQGRAFDETEDREGRQLVAVLTDGYFRRRFGGDPAVVGRQIQLSGDSYTVIGVLAPEFDLRLGAQPPQILIPLVLDPARRHMREFRALTLLGRLGSGVTLERAQAEMEAVGNRFRSDYPNAYDRDWKLTLVPLQEDLVRDVRGGLLVLLAAVALVLVIACVNVANLTLARATARDKEVALRTALGAGRGGLIRQFLVESLLLAVVGGVLGLMLAWWALRVLVVLAADRLPRAGEIGLDLPGVLFTLGITVATGLAFGLVPALKASRTHLQGLLKEGGKTSAVGTGRNKMRSALVVIEVALALLVLVLAGLILRSFDRVQEVDPGFRAENLLTLQIRLTPSGYPDRPQRAAYADRLLEQVRGLSGVRQAAVATGLPLGEIRFQIETLIEGQPAVPGAPPFTTDWRPVSPGYFGALGIPLVKGREFSSTDVVGATEVAVVDQSLAERFWPGQDPLGRRIKLQRPNNAGGWLTIVGVAGHVRNFGLDADSGEQVYTPFAQTPFEFVSLVVRTDAEPAALVPRLRDAVRSLDRELPVDNIQTMEKVIDDSLAGRRSYALLFGAFAAVSLILVAVGVYGIMAYTVAQRLQEIGIRMALGAQRTSVVQMVVGQGLTLAGVGVVLGLALTGLVNKLFTAFSSFVSSLLFGVGATDALTYAAVAMGLLFLALLATWLPARRATKVDPMVALRWN